MKRLAVFLFVSVLLAGTVFAQNKENRPEKKDRKSEVTQVTVEGVFKLEKGIVAVASGDSVYYVPMLTRYIGFIDGLKEGTKVSVEGAQFKNVIRPVKVTISGKSYDFPVYGRGDNGNKLSQGSEPLKQPRNFPGPRRQARPFGRGGFGAYRW